MDLLGGLLNEQGQIVEHQFAVGLIGKQEGHVVEERRHVAEPRFHAGLAPDVVEDARGAVGKLGLARQVDQSLELPDRNAGLPDGVEDFAVRIEPAIQRLPLVGMILPAILAPNELHGLGDEDPAIPDIRRRHRHRLPVAVVGKVILGGDTPKRLGGLAPPLRRQGGDQGLDRDGARLVVE